MSQFSSPFAMQRAKRQEQLAGLGQPQNPFVPHANEAPSGPANPFLEQKVGKEKRFQQSQQKKPWMQTPGMFGVDRQAAMMGGLGLLMGGY
jgi:hypothetical protein